MISRGKVLISALALCALAVYAFAAVSASASELTAVTCEKVGPGGHYNTSQCATPEVSGEFETKAIPVNTTTEVTGSATEIEPTLRATIGGSAVTVVCASTEIVGATVTNREPSAGKHTIEGTATRTTFTGCKAVLKANEARSCLVEEVTGPTPGTKGMISTTAIKGTSTGVEHKGKVSPAEGELFTKFTILNKAKGGVECPFVADVAVEVKGSVEGEANTTNHAHATFTEANNGTALKANGGTANYLTTVGGVMAGTTTVVGAQTFT